MAERKKQVRTKAQKEARVAKTEAERAIRKELGMTVKEYKIYKKVQKEKINAEKLEAEKAQERKEIEERIANKTAEDYKGFNNEENTLRFNSIDEIYALERGVDTDEALRYLIVVDSSSIARKLALDLYIMFVKELGGGDNKILFRQNNDELHIRGNTKFQFVCKNKLNKVPTMINHYDGVYYAIGIIPIKLKDIK